MLTCKNGSPPHDVLASKCVSPHLTVVALTASMSLVGFHARYCILLELRHHSLYIGDNHHIHDIEVTNRDECVTVKSPASNFLVEQSQSSVIIFLA